MTTGHDTAARWLSIVGVGEDGAAGLTAAARDRVAQAELIAGGRRHLDLLFGHGKPELAWETPFAASIPALLALRGRRVVALASGDPFWFGLGGVLAPLLPADEYEVFPAPSAFSLAAARLGWRLEEVATLGLHARPLATLRPHLRDGARSIVLLRDGAAPAELARRLADWGFGATTMTVLEALGGPRERIRAIGADAFDLVDVAAPVAVALSVAAAPGARVMPAVPGLPDEWFEHDGQITKREIRAITLSSLAPRGGDLLWDVGAGSGSVGIEWLLAHPANRAIGIEAREDRCARARRNAETLGAPRFDLRFGAAPDAFAGLPAPDAIFFGGGAGRPGALGAAWDALKPGGRMVVNAVTLETEALLIERRARHGGALLRLSIDRADAVGGLTGWRPAMPVTQWSATK